MRLYTYTVDAVVLAIVLLVAAFFVARAFRHEAEDRDDSG